MDGYAMCLVELIGNTSFKIDDVFAITESSCILFVQCKDTVKRINIQCCN